MLGDVETFNATYGGMKVETGVAFESPINYTVDEQDGTITYEGE
jgi:hypothetical protein